jgi:hypothetical protein
LSALKVTAPRCFWMLTLMMALCVCVCARALGYVRLARVCGFERVMLLPELRGVLRRGAWV